MFTTGAGHLRLSSILCLDLVLPSVTPDAVSSSLFTNSFFQNLDARCFPIMDSSSSGFTLLSC